jgi:predicted  nucleic acid-binding Zn-ribbon protein
MHTHKHKCDRCAHVWEHGEHCAGDTKAHTCTQCGSEQWSRHYDSVNDEIRDFVNQLSRMMERQY